MIKITVDNSSEFYQFDVNRSVIVSGLDPGVKYEFHFTTDNMDSVIVKETTTDDDGNISSKIPNKLLTEHYPIILLIYGSHDGITKTYYKGSLTPIARPKPDGYVLPDDEDDVIAYFKLKKDIDALKTAVENLKNNGGSGGGDYSEDIENILAEINALKLFDENVLKNYTTKEELKDATDRLSDVYDQVQNHDGLLYGLKDSLNNLLASPIKEFPTTLSPNKSYNFKNIPTSMISFPSPSESNDGDVVYVTFYVGEEVPNGLAFDITHTSDIDIAFSPNTGYEIFGKYNGSKWIVNYSEYTITDGDSV